MVDLTLGENPVQMAFIYIVCVFFFAAIWLIYTLIPYYPSPVDRTLGPGTDQHPATRKKGKIPGINLCNFFCCCTCTHRNKWLNKQEFVCIRMNKHDRLRLIPETLWKSVRISRPSTPNRREISTFSQIDEPRRQKYLHNLDDWPVMNEIFIQNIRLMTFKLSFLENLCWSEWTVCKWSENFSFQSPMNHVQWTEINESISARLHLDLTGRRRHISVSAKSGDFPTGRGRATASRELTAAAR